MLNRVRVGSKTIRRHLESTSSELTSEQEQLCLGILQHHADDDLFHNNPTFITLNHELAANLRRLLEEQSIIDESDSSMRVHFIAHVAIELLLDAHLIEWNPAKIAEYYRVIDGLNVDIVGRTIESVLQRPIEKLPMIIRRFAVERFLYDYLDDVRMLRRLNQVMKRVGLPQLPTETTRWLRESRSRVNRHADAMLTAESGFQLPVSGSF